MILAPRKSEVHSEAPGPRQDRQSEEDLQAPETKEWIFKVFGTAKRERGSFRGLDLLHGEEEFCAEAMFFLKSEEEIVKLKSTLSFKFKEEFD